MVRPDLLSQVCQYLMFKTEQEMIEHHAHQWQTVRQMLIEVDCPIEDGCHIPTVVGRWLEGITAMRRFSANGTKGFDAADVARQLEEAAHKADSSLLQVAAIVIRRLIAGHVCYLGGKPITVSDDPFTSPAKGSE